MEFVDRPFFKPLHYQAGFPAESADLPERVELDVSEMVSPAQFGKGIKVGFQYEPKWSGVVPQNEFTSRPQNTSDAVEELLGIRIMVETV